MLYLLTILVFLIVLLSMLFAKDSFINREVDVYNVQIQQPWLDRVILLKAHDSLFI
ncbi:gp58-like protein [Phenacoccus solenopsis nudivirus]|nr:gp58-like protein [Phenacoccus solenopsis nudivirus]